MISRIRPRGADILMDVMANLAASRREEFQLIMPSVSNMDH